MEDITCRCLLFMKCITKQDGWYQYCYKTKQCTKYSYINGMRWTFQHYLFMQLMIETSKPKQHVSNTPHQGVSAYQNASFPLNAFFDMRSKQLACAVSLLAVARCHHSLLFSLRERQLQHELY